MTLLSKVNSFVVVDPGNALLTYGADVHPAPLTVSASDSNPTIGMLQIVITNNTADSVEVDHIDVRVPVGSGAALMQTAQNVGTLVSDPQRWTFQLHGAVHATIATYRLRGTLGSPVQLAKGEAVVASLVGFQTVLTPCTAQLVVHESIADEGRDSKLLVTTFPALFFLRGLSATVKQGSLYTPVAQVPRGYTVTLLWSSSVIDPTAIEIRYSDAQQGQRSVNPKTPGEWTTPDGLTADTVFTLAVTTTSDAGDKLVATTSIVVAVQDPDLVATSIRAAGFQTDASAVKLSALVEAGKVQLTDTLSGKDASFDGPVLLNDTLTVAKVIQLHAPLTVTDNVSISGTAKPLSVKGAIDLGSGVEFVHSNGTQGLGIAFNTLYTVGTLADQDIVLAPRGAGRTIAKGTQQLVGTHRLWEGDVGYGTGDAPLSGFRPRYALGGPNVPKDATRHCRFFIVSWDCWHGDNSGSALKLSFVGQSEPQNFFLPPIWGGEDTEQYVGQAYSNFFPYPPGAISNITINSWTGTAQPDALIRELWVEYWDFY